MTFHIFMFSLLFFRAQSHEMSIDMINQILYYFQGEVFTQFVVAYPVVFGLIILGYILHFMPMKVEVKTQEFITALPLPAKAALLTLLVWLVAQFKSADIKPFIYFQF